MKYRSPDYPLRGFQYTKVFIPHYQMLIYGKHQQFFCLKLGLGNPGYNVRSII